MSAVFHEPLPENVFLATQARHEIEGDVSESVQRRRRGEKARIQSPT
jgi:hypothetical protein